MHLKKCLPKKYIQNFFLKKLLSQKIYFKNLISQPIHTLKKLLPQKMRFKNYSLKDCISKIAPSKNRLQKIFWKVAPSKSIFQKLFPQNVHLKKNSATRFNLQSLKLKIFIFFCLLTENLLSISKIIFIYVSLIRSFPLYRVFKILFYNYNQVFILILRYVFYTQTSLFFHLLSGSCNIRDHIAAFFLYLSWIFFFFFFL